MQIEYLVSVVSPFLGQTLLQVSLCSSNGKECSKKKALLYFPLASKFFKCYVTAKIKKTKNKKPYYTFSECSIKLS